MTRWATRPVGRGVLGALLLALTTFAAPSQALAHAHLRHSAPANGAHLSTVPRELRLAFSEDVVADVSRIEMVGPDGTVDLGALALAPDSGNLLVIPIRGALKAGEYRVTYQVTAADGHPVRGSFAFVIAPGASGLAPPPAPVPVGPTAPGQSPPPASHHPAASMPEGEGFGVESPLYVAVRWLGFGAMLVLVGAVAFRWLILPRVHHDEGVDAAVLRGTSEAGAARAGLAAAVVLGVAAVLRLLAQSVALHGAGDAFDPFLVGTMLTHTTWGWAWLLQAAGVAVAVLAFRLVGRGIRGGITAAAAPAQPATEAEPATAPEPGKDPAPTHRDRVRSGWMLAAAAALALALASALSGHAAAVEGLGPLPVLADALHVLSAGAWLGSLFVVLFAGMRAAGTEGEGRARGVAGLVNAFSPVALASAAVLAATGVFAAAMQLDSVAALWQSGYGRTLLVKLALLSVVFATGAYNWKRVQPALGEETAVGRLRRSAGVELTVGALVLLVTAVLVATAPPGGM